MTLTDKIRVVAEKKRLVDTVWEDVVLVQNAIEQEGTVRAPRFAAPIVYKYVGKALFPNEGEPNVLELAYAHMGEFLSRYYPSCVQHHFLTERTLASRRRTEEIINERLNDQGDAA